MFFDPQIFDVFLLFCKDQPLPTRQVCPLQPKKEKPVIIPSIDIRAGKAVQLRQGRELILTDSRDPIELAREFNRYGPVAVVDLDAALGTGDNLALIEQICRVAEVRVGGGIRSYERGRDLLRFGAQKLIIGSAAQPELLRRFNPEYLVVALDHRDLTVVDHGWTNSTGESVLDRARRLAPFCSEFLCTFVEVEGTMQGFPVQQALSLFQELPRPVTFAGGVKTTEEAIDLCRQKLTIQVGISLYTGRLDLTDVFVKSLDFERVSGLIPTIVQDAMGQVLMLAYSTPESLALAIRFGQGIYFSRSRNEIWVKGRTSGHTQQLLCCRTDCDQDALLFRVKQKGHTCHTGQYSCFGDQTFSVELLFQVMQQRVETSDASTSYTKMLASDPEALLRKIMEEAFELTRAEIFEEKRWEVTDVLHKLLIYLVAHGLTWQDLMSELRSRHLSKKEPTP
ncbi:MAG: Phosphoribosyl-ATP diphosphatase [Candidatus Uhrbacteria bacterium GW2011_GWE2_40_58]|nr:MAG: Phosphoribosyl-ATP diphosphatase [Candidatus Uhrbacteria bacterium GW2011_GWF2_40_263]KKR68228.1 MAG: Phosphoribosyl-ATP diphosphatase [Candidatus Uhrbacteria bacterium GW2011_GWE2_40_58]HBK35124.1 phosphoribosyl-ATP diphosphatase [Candidatus Uhrbacteria bacterium]HCB56235.1 phosphoribosyl-ATP diphosphatase [Candidatus Uhrbacteria bacterium]